VQPGAKIDQCETSGSSTLECIAVAAMVFALWAVLAGERAATPLAMGLAVAVAAGSWARLLDR